MNRDDAIVTGLTCCLTAILCLAGLGQLVVNLKEVQCDEVADYNYHKDRQSIRRVQIAGLRGRILDRGHGDREVVLADNRPALSIAVDAAAFQRKTWAQTTEAVSCAISNLAIRLGRVSPLSTQAIRRHVNQALAVPLIVWREISESDVACLSENERSFPGFMIVENEERRYPQESLAAHLLGYVGRDRNAEGVGDERFNYFAQEMRGRSGLEAYYDRFLRGVSGERKVRVDARGFSIESWIVADPQRGLDLKLTLDAAIQREAERQLAGCVGACVVLDPRNGDVLALASAPGFNPNTFEPVLRSSVYESMAHDKNKPLLNRASGGAYAPGSTFKPITALAGLRMGYPEQACFGCYGYYELGPMRLHCTSRWGHGEIDIRHALMKSCNPFFCNLGMEIGTNALMRTAHDFGLGSKTGLDLMPDMAGTVPNGKWKREMYGEPWYLGDLVQMSIGQGMLLVSPLQMACVAGAIATGYRVTPHLKLDVVSERRPLPFTQEQLAVVRDGMRMAVNGDGEERGTGWRGGLDVPVRVCGKTGTAEVGRGESRRKNVWFIAYAPSENPRIAIALIVENGESGGGTAAPKVAAILRRIFCEG